MFKEMCRDTHVTHVCSYIFAVYIGGTWKHMLVAKVHEHNYHDQCMHSTHEAH